MSLIFNARGDYSRSYGDAHNVLHNKLCKLYAKDLECAIDSVICPSGLNATSVLLTTLIDQNYINNCLTTILYSDELYDDTVTLFKDFAAYRSGVEIKKVNFSDSQALQQAVEKNDGRHIILYTESCSNPHGKIPDFDTLRYFHDYYDDMTIIVDNTWLTSVLFDPFEHGADYVVLSLTKYYSGSTAMGGAIVGRFDDMKMVDEHAIKHGVHVSEVNCREISNGIDSMRERITEASNRTLQLLNLFETRVDRFDNICHIVYDQNGNRKLFKHGLVPSVFTVQLFGVSKKQLKNMNFKTFSIKTSYGGPDSRIDPWSIKKFQCGSEICTEIRISVGYESDVQGMFEDLIQ